MVWIVEDGSVVTGANTYTSDTDAIAYALARGVVIDLGDIDVLMQKAMDYLESRVYIGQQASIVTYTYPTTQPLQWPRDYAYIDGLLIGDDHIPTPLIKAESELIMALNASYDPLATITKNNQVKEESFAVFKKVYMDSAIDQPILQKVNAWLSPLLLSGDGYHFTVDRSYG